MLDPNLTSYTRINSQWKTEIIKIQEKTWKNCFISLEWGSLSNDDSKSSSHRKKSKTDYGIFTWQNKHTVSWVTYKLSTGKNIFKSYHRQVLASLIILKNFLRKINPNRKSEQKSWTENLLKKKKEKPSHNMRICFNSFIEKMQIRTTEINLFFKLENGQNPKLLIVDSVGKRCGGIDFLTPC